MSKLQAFARGWLARLALQRLKAKLLETQAAVRGWQSRALLSRQAKESTPRPMSAADLLDHVELSMFMSMTEPIHVWDRRYPTSGMFDSVPVSTNAATPMPQTEAEGQTLPPIIPYHMTNKTFENKQKCNATNAHIFDTHAITHNQPFFLVDQLPCQALHGHDRKIRALWDNAEDDSMPNALRINTGRVTPRPRAVNCGSKQ